MAVSILSYQREALVTGTPDLLAKLESFASGLGWMTELQTDVTWTHLGGGNYAWGAGTRTFLELKSVGYGAQQLVYRFAWDVTTAGTRGILLQSLIDPNNPTYSTTSSTSPEAQNRINTTTNYRRMSLPDAAYTDGVYFFGNKRFIAVICGLYSDAQASFAMGLPDMISDFHPKLDVSFFFAGENFHTDASACWWDSLKSNLGNWISFWGCMNITGPHFRYDGTQDGSTTGGIHTNLTLHSTPSDLPRGRFTNLWYLTRYNTYSDKRIGGQPTIFGRNVVTGQFHPIGSMPFVLLPYGGLSIAGSVSYGSEVYMVFPYQLQASNWGYGFRVL